MSPTEPTTEIARMAAVTHRPAAPIAIVARSPITPPATPATSCAQKDARETEKAQARVHATQHRAWRDRLNQADRVDEIDRRGAVADQLLCDEQRDRNVAVAVSDRQQH